MKDKGIRFKDDVKDILDVKVINGETAIKPYYYLRNGLLHARYTVDRCVELSEWEEARLKEELTAKPSWKQDTLRYHWELLTEQVGKTIMHDGIKAGEERMKELSRKYENGRKN